MQRPIFETEHEAARHVSAASSLNQISAGERRSVQGPQHQEPVDQPFDVPHGNRLGPRCARHQQHCGRQQRPEEPEHKQIVVVLLLETRHERRKIPAGGRGDPRGCTLPAADDRKTGDQMRLVRQLAATIVLLAVPTVAYAQPLTAAGQPAQLDVRSAGDRSIRVTLKPVSFKDDFPVTPALAGRESPAPALSLREITTPVRKAVGSLDVEVRPHPLSLIVRNSGGRVVQEVVFEPDGTLSFKVDDQPVLGMGGGGPKPAPGSPWREQPVQFDRRAWTRMTCNDRARQLTIEPGAPQDATNVAPERVFRVVVLPDGTATDIRYSGKRVLTAF